MHYIRVKEGVQLCVCVCVCIQTHKNLKKIKICVVPFKIILLIRHVTYFKEVIIS